MKRLSSNYLKHRRDAFAAMGNLRPAVTFPCPMTIPETEEDLLVYIGKYLQAKQVEPTSVKTFKNQQRYLTLREIQMMTILSLLATTGARPSEIIQCTHHGYPSLKWQDICFHAVGIQCPTSLRQRKNSKRLSRHKESLIEDVTDAILTLSISPRTQDLRYRGLCDAFTWFHVFAWAR